MKTKNNCKDNFHIISLQKVKLKKKKKIAHMFVHNNLYILYMSNIFLFLQI